MIRLWREPDGSIKVTAIAAGADVAQVASILVADGHVSKNATWEDMEESAFEAAAAGLDRALRHKWRAGPGGKGLVVDATVPDLVDPDQGLLDQLDASTSLPELRAVVRAILLARRT